MPFKNLLILAILIITSSCLPGQQLWKEIHSSSSPDEFVKYNINISSYKIYELDLAQLKHKLVSAPDKLEMFKSKDGVTINIPMPDGNFINYTFYKASILHPDLARNYPGIESFCAKSKEDPQAYLRCDYSPEDFNCMILSSKYGTVFIDPMTIKGKPVYVVYQKHNYNRVFTDPFKCLLNNLTKEIKNHSKLKKTTESNVADCLLRTYSLALACTGEYAAFHGGTKAKVLAAMNKTITRVSGVYEVDLGVTFQLIANNDILIYLNAATDPYTNDDGGTMLDENQTTIDTKIGKANYDIGHVFSTGGGGIASLSSVCSNNNKAQGVTGLTSPIGDGFDIDYVAHEIGHQFNADHSFNNDCDGNISFSTSYETGSGTTIMGYAGVCDPNVQNHSDPYFHVISLDEITNYITVQTGNTCPTKTLIGNSSPTVNAGQNKTIPKNTPFELKAIGNDIDADTLTYCWEQFDNEITAQPPTSTAFEGPVFRSLLPTTSPIRVFPMISAIVNNSTSTWEVLPSVARTLNFRVTARDNHSVAGCYATDDLTLTVNGSAGPFLVTYPNTNIAWIVGDTQTVTWNVALTNLTPVSCPKVDIYLSVDGGYTYPYLLKSGVANDGSQDIVVPGYTGNKNRIKIKGSNNYFFDISNQNFEIKNPQTPTFVQTLDKETGSYCANDKSSFVIKSYFNQLGGFSDSIGIIVDSLPANTSYQVIKAPGIPTDSATIIIKGIDQLNPGTYTIHITAYSSTISKQASFTFSISTGLPSEVANFFPANNSKNVSTNPTLEWSTVPFANSYFLQVSTDPGFINVIHEVIVNDIQEHVYGLDIYNVYYWRVFAENYCGRGLSAVVNSFQTINTICDKTSQTQNITIPNNAESTKTSSLAINSSGQIISIEASVKLNHNYISDILLDLSGPDGKTISLFAGSCGSGNDMDATYSDNGDELICQGSPPSVSGIIKPANGQFSQWANSNMKGNWELKIQDTYPEDGGFLDEWSLNICREDSSALDPGTPESKTLYVLENTSRTIDSFHLKIKSGIEAPEDIDYVLTSIPPNGTLLMGLNELKVGSKFSQAEIDKHNIVYMQSQPGNSLDSFTYDILDNNGHWNPAHTFHIIIYKALKLKLETKDLSCNDFNDGEIHLTAFNGIPPYSYSIDSGKVYFITPDFTGLSAGTYNIIIKDSLGLKVVDTVVINQPEPLTDTIKLVSNNIIINVSGGTQPHLTSLDGINFSDTLEYHDLNNGTYFIYIKDANGCQKIDSITIDIVSTKAFERDLLKVYPIPTSGIIYIQSPIECDLYYTLIDNSGRVIRNKIHKPLDNNNIFSIDISDLSNGMYFIILNTPELNCTRKLVLQK